MTHLIEHWQSPDNVISLQTTGVLNSDLCFDIHPDRSNPQMIQQLVDQFQLPHEPKFLHQVHGNQVVEYNSPLKEQLMIQADACFTREPDVICAIMTADCLPVLLTDSMGSFVAAIHCGWRSLYADILSRTIEQINSKHEIIAWFGPCIQQQQYQVDASFVDHYLTQHPDAGSAFTEIKNDKSFADLMKLATIQLQHHSIRNIAHDNNCTYLDPKLYSWRENQSLHRMATMIWKNST